MELEGLQYTVIGAGSVQARDPVTLSATWVSRLISPPIVSAIGLCFAAGWVGTPIAWTWAALELGMVVLFPALYVSWLISRGQISDIDLSRREQRTLPYLMTVAGACLAAVLSLELNAPQPLSWLSIAVAAQVAVLCLITLRWKISLHSAAIASLCVVLTHFVGLTAFSVILCVPLVAWARLRLRRHTLMQTVAGTLVGAVIYIAALQFAAMS